MKQFFISVFATITGIILSMIIVFLILAGIIAGLASSADEKEAKIETNSILKLDFENGIAERSSKSPFENFDLNTLKDNKRRGLNDILRSLEHAKTDEKISGVVLDLTALPAGIATVEEIRNALTDFKKSGKFLLSYSENYTQGAYYLASVCDKIYIHPEGLLQWTGLNAELSFFKGTLEKLDLEMQVFKHGKYKSAVEPYTNDQMSDANRQQLGRLLQSVWDDMLGKIASARKVGVDSLNAFADELAIQSASDAVEKGLVDAAVYFDEFEKILKEKTALAEKDKLKQVTIDKYVSSINKRNKSKDKIAVVYAVGSIMSGEGSEEQIGSENISKAIREARLDENVKAIVLRVNSPGGSSLASDVIWREVVLAKAKKPVIVSMGDVAASGGYYISCAADAIYAQPNTITGSIGVFGVIPNTGKMLKNKLGITIDRVATNKHSGMPSITRPADEAESAAIQNIIEDIYATFIKNVADGRKMTTAQVDSIGQGRVWTGIDAKSIGLVDEIGGINDAIHAAAKKAGLADYKIQSLPKQKEPLEEILKSLKGDVESEIEAKLGEQYTLYKQMQEAMSWQGVQARLPFDVVIK